MTRPTPYSLTTRIDGKDGQRMFCEDRGQLIAVRDKVLREGPDDLLEVTTVVTNEADLSFVFWLGSNDRLERLTAEELSIRLYRAAPTPLARFLGNFLGLVFVISCAAGFIFLPLIPVVAISSRENLTTTLALFGGAAAIALVTRYASAYLLEEPSPGFFALN